MIIIKLWSAYKRYAVVMLDGVAFSYIVTENSQKDNYRAIWAIRS